MNKKILQDHKRKGKTLVPPFVDMVGPLHEISWVKTILPELLWIALIHNHYGDSKAVRLITSFNRLALKCSPSEKKHVFTSVSSFQELNSDQQSRLREEATNSGELFSIQKALEPLIAFYPECPLCFLYSTTPCLSDDQDQHLENLKAIVAYLYDKTSRNAMMVQATAIWLAFDSETLKVFEGSALANFPEIERYPDTDLSQKIAGSIRSTLPMFFSEPHYSSGSTWPRYFWNRGLEIDGCYFVATLDDQEI